MGWSKPLPNRVRRRVLPPVGRPRGSAGAAPRIDDEVLQPTPFVCRSGTKCEGPRNAFFQAWRKLSVRCVITSDKPGSACRFTVGSEPGYRTRRKKHALPIVRDEFRPAIPRSGCSPALPVSASPARPDYHAPSPRLVKTGHFYFAGKGTFLLCLDTGLHARCIKNSHI